MPGTPVMTVVLDREREYYASNVECDGGASRLRVNRIAADMDKRAVALEVENAELQRRLDEALRGVPAIQQMARHAKLELDLEKKARQETEQRLQAAQEEFQRRLGEMEQAHARDLRAVNEAHAAEREKLCETISGQTREMNRMSHFHRQVVDGLDKEVAALGEEKARLAGQVDELRHECHLLEEQNAKIRTEHAAICMELDQKYKTLLARLLEQKEQHEAAMKEKDAECEARLAEVQKEVARLQDRITQMKELWKSDTDELEGKLKAEQAAHKQAQEELSEVSLSLQAAQQELRSKDQQLKIADETITELQSQLELLKEQVKEHVCKILEVETDNDTLEKQLQAAHEEIVALLAQIQARHQAVDSLRLEIDRLCNCGRQIELHEIELLHELPEVYQVHALQPLLHKKIQEATQELIVGGQRVKLVFDQHFPSREGLGYQ